MLMKLFKRDFKESLKTWIICTATLILLFVVIYASSGAMKNRGYVMVEQYFTMFATIIPLIYVITTANRLVVNQVEDDSFFMIMVSPYKRINIILTKIVYYVSSITIMHGLLMIVVAIMTNANPLAGLEPSNAILLCLYTFLITLAISSICFFASVFFNAKKNSSLLGTGFPLVSYILYTLSNMFTNIPQGDDPLPLIDILNNLKYVSIYSLCNSDLIAERSPWLIFIAIALVVFTGGVYTASSIVFTKKDLCL